MIPIKLSLKNFLCYKDNVPPLSFEGIHLACLVGENGAGKSALLDAITWALWGKARGKSNEEIVHQGQNEMEVELEFEALGKRYRVKRKFSKPLSQTLLELQLHTGDKFISISGDTLRETQRKIEKEILHMDYETFINSAFLLQGRANEFTKKAPGERKEVLGQILGLSFYDELEQLAKEKRKEKKGQKEEIERIIEEYEKEITKKPLYEKEKEEAQACVLRLKKEIEKREAEIEALRQEKQRLAVKREHLQKIEREIDGIREELNYWRKEMEIHNQNLKESEDILAQREKIEEGYNYFIRAKKEEEEFNRKLWQLLPLEQRKGEIEKEFHKTKTELDKKRELLLQRISHCQAKIDKLPQLEENRQSLLQEASRLAKEEERKKWLEGQYQNLLNLLSELKARKRQIEREREELEQKEELLARGEERCPLCETTLGAEGLALLRHKYKNERIKLKENLSSIEKELRERQEESQSLQSQITGLEAVLKIRPQIQGRILALEREIEEAKNAINEIQALKESLASIDAEIAEAELNYQQELREIEKEIEAIGYSREKHQETRREVERWRAYEEQKRRLEEAERNINSLKSAIERATQSYRVKLEQLKEKEKDSEALRSETERLPQIERDLAEKEEIFLKLKESYEGERKRLWEAEERIRNCEELAKKKEQKEREKHLAEDEERIYSHLADAFSKEGIQALLIEQALPPLFEEADRLLKRLTNDRMSIGFKTQRFTKKDQKVVETLDIIISDELGTRSYEMYSGGESFRIDFALRVALAKLVARRAGAPLPILIIDEGFGSQDAIGRENLIDAINTVAQEFEKVLIVTHIDELKERFPTRIEVIKTEEGSTYRVI